MDLHASLIVALPRAEQGSAEMKRQLPRSKGLQLPAMTAAFALAMWLMPMMTPSYAVSPRDTYDGFDGKAGQKKRLGVKTLRGSNKGFKRRSKTLIRLPPKAAKPQPRKPQPRSAPAIHKRPRGADPLSADQVAAKKAALLRRQRIKMMLALLRQIGGGTPSANAQRARLYHRLVEAYRDEAKYLYFVAMRQHTAQLDQWVQRCDQLRARKKACPPRPTPALATSMAYRTQSANVARRLLQIAPQYPRADEVHFSLLLTLQRLKRRRAVKAEFKRFVKRYPKSRFLADAHMVMADIAFSNNVVNDAWRHYKAAIQVATRRIKAATTPEIAVRMRGVHLRSTYMLAWCDFNIGDLPRSLKRFQRVYRLSRLYEKTKQSKITYRSESIRDMLQVYAKMGAARQAYVYFRKILGPQRAHRATRQIARRLVRLGNDAAAMKALAWLQQVAPNGRRDPAHQLVPLLQLQIVQSAQRIEKPDAVYRRVARLMSMIQVGSPWSTRWHKTKSYRETREAAAQALVTWSTSYHRKAQGLEQKKPKRAELLYAYAVKLYRSYLLAFPSSESCVELRFFLAELLYRKAEKRQGRSKRLRPAARSLYAQAARHYHMVAVASRRGKQGARSGNPYRKQATFAELLCYERLAGERRRFKIRRIDKKDLKVGPDGSVTWRREPIKPGTPQAHLISVYRRYLKITRDKQERLQTYFKLGVLYAAHRHYLRSTDIFSAMARENPQHELSRRAAFMILYSYQDLRQWKKLEQNARHFLKVPQLTKNRAFRKEMYELLIRAAYKPYLAQVKASNKARRQPGVALARRFLAYANEFGVAGPWARRGLRPSPRAPHAWAIAADCFVRSHELFAAIRARRQLLKRYPSHSLALPAMLSLGRHYEQIASYDQAAGWFERYALHQSHISSSQSPASSVKTRRTTKRRSRQPRAGKGGEVNAGALAALQKRRARALFRAAVYRRGLAQYDHAIRLYRKHLALFPGLSAGKELPLAIAQTYEVAKKWPEALTAYSSYLQKAQSKPLVSYLQKAVKLIAAKMPKSGLISAISGLHASKPGRVKKPLLLRRLGSLSPSTLNVRHLLFVQSRIAWLYRQLGQAQKHRERLMQIEAIGFQMYLHRMPAVGPGRPGREAFAKARFLLIEQQFGSYQALRFKGNLRQLRRQLKQTIALGKRMARDYAEVAALQSPEWALAAVFRTGYIYHLFARKLLSAPSPRFISADAARRYRQYIQMMAMRYEEPALDAYDAVLRKAAALGIDNRWVRMCQKARADLSRSGNKIDPYTIFRRRPSTYWLAELPIASFLPASSRPAVR